MLGFLKNIFYKVDEQAFDNLEESLILADCSAITASELVENLKNFAKENKIQDGEQIKEKLKEQLSDMLSMGNRHCGLDPQSHHSEEQHSSKPYILNPKSCLLIIGVNGVGKTTSIGKLAHFYKSQGKSVLLIAADTFRAAATEQLEIWAERADCPIVKGEQGASPSSVVFDGIKSAIAKNIDIILIDTAGRLHNKKDLMDELSKIRKTIDKAAVSSLRGDLSPKQSNDFTPEDNIQLTTINTQTLLVLDGSTGQNAFQQAKAFGEAVGATSGRPNFEEQHSQIDGIILTKLDSTAKGGAIISIAHEQSIPVRFIGLGEKITDLYPFDAKWFVEQIFE